MMTNSTWRRRLAKILNLSLRKEKKEVRPFSLLIGQWCPLRIVICPSRWRKEGTIDPTAYPKEWKFVEHFQRNRECLLTLWTVDVTQRHTSQLHVEVVDCTEMEPFWQAIPRDNCLKHDKPPAHPGGWSMHTTQFKQLQEWCLLRLRLWLKWVDAKINVAAWDYGKLRSLLHQTKRTLEAFNHFFRVEKSHIWGFKFILNISAYDG